jgi:hypothetical protein
MLDLFDEAGGGELCYFLADGESSLIGKAEKWLFDRLRICSHVETILSEFPRDAWHI